MGRNGFLTVVINLPSRAPFSGQVALKEIGGDV